MALSEKIVQLKKRDQPKNHRDISADALWYSLNQATLDYPTPLIALDQTALNHNFITLQQRAQGTPLRLATKSIRCRSVISELLPSNNIAGLLCYSLAEANWLVNTLDLFPEQTVLVGYPTVDTLAMTELLQSSHLLQHIVVMIDDLQQLDFIDQIIPPTHRPLVQICLDIDVSYYIPGLPRGFMKFGAYRSPLYDPANVVDLAREIVDRAGYSLVGVMTYDAQIAGVADRSFGKLAPVIRMLQDRSWQELQRRRGKIISQLRELTDLKFINGGGTGSIERNATDPYVTDIAAGSGLFFPHIFDHYSHFSSHPALGFALSITRHPQDDVITCFGGGWIASGKIARDRLPQPVWPVGLEYISLEGAGETQTPLRGRVANQLQCGDRVWFRHAKAGEVCEHVNTIYLVSGGNVIAEWLTYRGEGKAFG